MSVNELEVSYKPLQHSSTTYGTEEACQAISLTETFQNQANLQEQLEKPDFLIHPVGPCNAHAGAWTKCSFKEVRRGRGERSLHCSDQGQPILLISAESNEAEFFMQPYMICIRERVQDISRFLLLPSAQFQVASKAFF